MPSNRLVTALRSIVVPLACGLGTSLLAFQLGMPGDGTFVWVTLLLGAVAGISAATWLGAALVIAGATLGVVALFVVGPASSGLIVLIIAVLGALLGIGYLGGWVVNRIAAERRAVLRDRRVGLGIAVLVLTGLAAWWFAQEFARNPP